jgi:hypothetical protein
MSYGRRGRRARTLAIMQLARSIEPSYWRAAQLSREFPLPFVTRFNSLMTRIGVPRKTATTTEPSSTSRTYQMIST